jgi:methylthioribulose-1-phosphate dehydratase
LDYVNLDQKEKITLAELIRNMNQSGHNPATSGNYSLRVLTNPERAFISESGVDKALFSEHNFLTIDIASSELLPDFKSKKPSDETELHLAIYRATNAGCVLHSHLLESLLFCDLFPGKDFITMQDLELLKAFKGLDKNELLVTVPCFANDQDISRMSALIGPALIKSKNCFGFLIRGHGLYVWGNNIIEAKRHLDTFEYIFKYYLHANKR